MPFLSFGRNLPEEAIMAETAKRYNSANEENLKKFVGKTHGILRSGFMSVMGGSTDLFSGISSKLESAISVSGASSSEPSEVIKTGTSKDSACDMSGDNERSLIDHYDKFPFKYDVYNSESASSSRIGHQSSSGELSATNQSDSDWSVSSPGGETQSEETEIRSFMTNYVDNLFLNSERLSLQQKALFGQYAQTEIGRTWFARLINAHRSVTKCVSETSFFSLIQHFAIILFECAEADHFSPAKTLMNMCFTFYHEVQVPGCEPFKEYLSIYLKDQPIWRSLRFWNAAFFDALQCERLHRPVVTREELLQNRQEALKDDRMYQENITFGQLGTFTCNMHAFGLEKDLCVEFLRKQCSLASLAPDQEAMLHDNVNRMYAETDPWR